MTSGELAWFGQSWDQPGNAMFRHIETPVGRPCNECDVAFTVDDQGIACPPQLDEPWEYYHRGCWAPKADQADAFQYDEFGPPSAHS